MPEQKGWWIMLGRLRIVVSDLHEAGIPTVGFYVPLAFLLTSSLWIALTNIRANLTDFAIAIAGASFLLAGSVFYASFRRAPWISGLLGALGVLFATSTFGGFQINLNLTAAFPLVDRQLAAIDELAGIDHPTMITWLAAHSGLGDALGWFYRTTVPLLLGVAIALAALSRRSVLRTYLGLFVWSVALVAAISLVTPAVGTYVHYGIAHVAEGRLPEGSGIYHLEDFEMLRSGSELILGPFNVNGVVTFPSFHTTMTMIIVYGAWSWQILRLPAIIYAVGTLVATVLIGGHYVIDLVGGGAVFALAWGLAHARIRGLTHTVQALRGAPGAV
jgi:hypothetical protein